MQEIFSLENGKTGIIELYLRGGLHEIMWYQTQPKVVW